ncbi:hypothetical protein [uncultured Thermanaerothrix sp.]|uniref:hypothetical protein n=1 Tax=uncultured Thermanaerothrix sp. TaxID=1195149 RepID=UPI00263557DE|nr:hypothetical protein [uncultured Thermanaerothrix sp.]
MTDTLWSLIAFVLTLAILSYAIGDNPLFRIALYTFVGISAGYLAVVLIDQVIFPRLITPLVNPSTASGVMAIPLLLSLLLLTRLSPRLSFLGSLPMAFLVGVGAAVIINGALFGTLFTQVRAAGLSFTFPQSVSSGWITGMVLLFGAITTLLYFQFTGRREPGKGIVRPAWVEWIARIGQGFIAITLGAFFAGVILASLTVLIGRLDFVLQFINTLVP